MAEHSFSAILLKMRGSGSNLMVLSPRLWRGRTRTRIRILDVLPLLAVGIKDCQSEQHFASGRKLVSVHVILNRGSVYLQSLLQ